MNSAVHRRRKGVLPPDVDAIVVLIRGDVEVTSWPLTERGRPDLDVVDELVRWQFAARRLGCSIRLRDASVDLWELLDFLGLAEVVTGVAGLRAEAGESDDPLA